MAAPVFPITFHWFKSGRIEEFESLEDIEWNVEDFDSEADGGEASVVVAKGRPVRIRVSLLSMELFELL